MDSVQFERRVCGRKFCSACKHWRLIIDFPVHTWADEDKTVPKRMQSSCYTCRRVVQRPKRRRENMTPQQIATVRATSRAHWRRKSRREGVVERGPYKRASGKSGSVPREPFADWIRNKLRFGHSYKGLAVKTGVPDRMLRAYVDGYTNDGRPTRNGKHMRIRKLRVVDHVDLATVDKALLAFDEQFRLDELYPLDDDTSGDQSLLPAA